MINAAEIEKRIDQVITGSGLFPRIAWANKDLAQERPYLAVAVVPASVTDATLAQGRPVWTGFLVLTAVTALNVFETPGQTLLKSAGDLFVAGRAGALTLDSGKKLICGHPNQLPPYRAGEDYRLPLRITLRTEG